MSRVLVLVTAASLLSGCASIPELTSAASAAVGPCPTAKPFKSTVHGMGGNDQVFSGGQPAQLFGDDDRDLVVGLFDADEINGGRDADILVGAGGADRFVYDRVEDSPVDGHGTWASSAGDTIVDFRPDEGDRIVLTKLSPVAGFRWGSSDQAFGIWVRPFHGDTLLFIDSNGDHRADLAIRLLGTMQLSQASFCV